MKLTVPKSRLVEPWDASETAIKVPRRPYQSWSAMNNACKGVREARGGRKEEGIAIARPRKLSVDLNARRPRVSRVQKVAGRRIKFARVWHLTRPGSASRQLFKNRSPSGTELRSLSSELPGHGWNPVQRFSRDAANFASFAVGCCSHDKPRGAFPGLVFNAYCTVCECFEAALPVFVFLENAGDLLN